MLGILSFIASNFLYLFLKVSYTQSFPPPLPPKEEAECFRLMKEGDESARSRLIEHNLRLVAHIVKKYCVSNQNQDDLISIGTIGLIKAIDTFDVSAGTRFATYAGKCLQNEILMYFRAQKKTAGEVSMNDPIDTDKDGNPLTYLDIISVDDTIADDIDSKTKAERALKIIANDLPERERKVKFPRMDRSPNPAWSNGSIGKMKWNFKIIVIAAAAVLAGMFCYEATAQEELSSEEKIKIQIQYAHLFYTLPTLPGRFIPVYYTITRVKRKRSAHCAPCPVRPIHLPPSFFTASSAKELSTSSANGTRRASSPFDSITSCSRVNASSVMTGVFIHESVSR